MISSIKFKLPNKLYAQPFTAVQQMINNMPNSNHPTLEDIEVPYWYDINDQEEVEDKHTFTTLPDDVPYLRRSIRNLRCHQPIDGKS